MILNILLILFAGGILYGLLVFIKWIFSLIRD